ncbi:MAG: hypothetical protein QM788_05490 [Roseateles sp.]|uniref:hypothetical protein n=1 Tax=Roseateles sp. TaxID=1971397 RepID=UPI0039EAEF13
MLRSMRHIIQQIPCRVYLFKRLRKSYVIEVKSSTTGSFGSLPAIGPEAFLRDRAAKAETGQGFWRDANVSNEVKLAAKDIGTNFRNGGTNPPTVIGYKFEVSIPKSGQSATPTVTIKTWGP